MSLPQQRLSEREFIPLTALVISLVALSIDAMLPALPNIGRDLELTDINDAQLIIGVVLLAAGFGVFQGEQWARWTGIVASSIAIWLSIFRLRRMPAR